MTADARTWARRGLLGLAAVGLLEWTCAAVAYRDRVTGRDFDAVRQAIGEGETVWLATDWLGPRARMTIPALARPGAIARPDLRGVGRFVVLGLDAAWSDALAADLEDLPPPVVVASETIGPLTLTTYEQPHAGQVLDALDADPRRVQVTVDGDRCKGQQRWRCTLGSVSSQIAEIDYRPRACLAVAADDAVTTRIEVRRMTTGNVLRGHVGFADFNARLRSDAVAEVAVVVDGEVAGRLLVTDSEGWRAFAVPTEPGTHAVALEVTQSASGTWGRDGYGSKPAHAACVELRALSEDA